MKKFKLLRDLPGATAGDIIVYKDGDIYFEKCSDDTTPSFQTVDEHLLGMLENMIRELEYDGWLEEIEEEPKSIYKLKEGDEYWWINEGYEVEKRKIDDSYEYSSYKFLLDFGNVFLTKQEAEKELFKRKALARIKRWIWKNNINLGKIGDRGYTIIYERGLYITDRSYDAFGWADLIFLKKEDAEKCLEECKKDWEILFDLR